MGPNKHQRLPGWIVAFWMLSVGVGAATPPYGDPNQPYDRLPGTLETYHVKWAKPYAGGKLNVLFIIPYFNSREVVEAAQRLDVNYTVIMNAGASVWDKGSGEGANATPLKGLEAKTVLENITRERLNPAHNYDAIVIAKISWVALPGYVRDAILKHVERGAGLVYVTPNHAQTGFRSKTESPVLDPLFNELFRTNSAPDISGQIMRGLPLDVMPLHMVKTRGEYRGIPGMTQNKWSQSSVYVSSVLRGSGRILALDYFDSSLLNPYAVGNSLSPYFRDPSLHPHAGDNYAVMYDYAFALLTRAIVWSARKETQATLDISFSAAGTSLTAPDDPLMRNHSWERKTPRQVIARDDLAVAKAILKIIRQNNAPRVNAIIYDIRDLTGKAVLADRKVGLPVEGADSGIIETNLPLPILSRGTYLLDARLLDATERVIDFASAAFRVETPDFIASITTDKAAYREGDMIVGAATFAQSLDPSLTVKVYAVDTWGRTVSRAKTVVGNDRRSVAFRMPVSRPLSRLWDVYCEICDERGVVDRDKTWVGLPNWTFDDYTMMLIFAPQPDLCNWKGNLYGTVMRAYGVNAAFIPQTYGDMEQQCIYTERYHLQNVSYADALGESESYRKNLDASKEDATSDIAEMSRMCRHAAETGELPNNKMFPYQWPQGAYSLNADRTAERISWYQFTARFGTPFYALASENHLLGEMRGEEYSGFAPLTTRKFQEWCREQYGNDLNALNAEWGSDFKSWDNVRGILLTDAVERNQLPRWVDFRYFMRSRVWSQFFLDYSDMIRRFVPDAHTGKLGHDGHDFSRYRDRMSCCKLYIGQEPNSEWRHAIVPELYQSFTGDNTYLLASQSLIRWTYDIETPLNRERWPWLVLFMGLHGFDWERGLTAETLGGESCLTPDMSEPLPVLVDIAREVKFLERGIGKLTLASKPYRSKTAMLWAPYNHYISRLHPFQENGFSGTRLYNISVVGGAPSDCLALLNSLRIRPTIVAPEDLKDNGLRKRGFRALILPYNKGMSQAEADAVREFVREGGLVMADNTPGIYSEHGRELKTPRLADLFPSFERKTVTRFGKGKAAYLPNEINGYLARMEKCDYTGSDSVGTLLAEYAGETPPVELIDARGIPRRDTLMPVFLKGGTILVGLLRTAAGGEMGPEDTTMRLKEKRHIWDVRNRSYLGFTNSLPIRLDLRPKYYALLPVNPQGVTLVPEQPAIRRGGTIALTGRVICEGVKKEDVAAMGQAAHIRVLSPTGNELECFRQNVVFEGEAFRVELPIAWSEIPGRYIVEAEHVLTGQRAKACFDVAE